MGKMMETVLYYNPGRPETMKHVAMMKSVLVRMGVRIKNIGQDQVMETVGYLAGMDGFKPRAEGGGEEDGQNEPEINEPEQNAPSQNGPGSCPEIPAQVMVLKQFSGRRLDELLMNLRKAGVPKIELKAVLTEYNSLWTFYHLYEELKEEHAAMGTGKGV